MLIGCCGVAPGEEGELLSNPAFKHALDGWVFRPGDNSQVSLVDEGADRAKVLEMRPAGRLLGVETKRLVIGEQLGSDQAYKGAVTCVLEAPSNDDWRTRYWDVPDRYRKHYLATYLGRTVPPDREFHYRVVTVPFEAQSKQWKEQAQRVAESRISSARRVDYRRMAR